LRSSRRSARVTTEGWGARLLALQGDDGLWEGGALFPARKGDSDAGDRSADGDRSDDSGQPWTATAYSLVLLRDLGVDPRCDQVRRAVTLVRDNCRWEHAGQPFFSGEVEPCINGMVIALGTYFDQDVDGVVARLVGEQLEDGGWNCWVAYGSLFVRDHDQGAGRAAGARASNRWLGGVHRGSTPG
ncbi:MAG TPA: hypothetical protein VIJ13_10995, partial [Actinomycetota bacterium]